MLLLCSLPFEKYSGYRGPSASPSSLKVIISLGWIQFVLRLVDKSYETGFVKLLKR